MVTPQLPKVPTIYVIELVILAGVFLLLPQRDRLGYLMALGTVGALLFLEAAWLARERAGSRR